MTKYKVKRGPNGITYSLQEHFNMRDDNGLLVEDSESLPNYDKYRGCGNGFIVVDKATNQVVDMAYSDDGVSRLDDQNMEMCADAGRVIKEDQRTITYRVNFSCWTACLF